MYFICFMILSGLCIAGGLGVESVWLTVVMWYGAFSFAVVGVAYLASQPTWLMKRASGTISPLGWLLYGPFLAVNGMLFHIHRLASSESLANEVVPGLWLGRLLTDSEANHLDQQPVAVLDLVCEFMEPKAFRNGSGYLLMPVLDGTAPTQDQLRQGIKHIADHIARGPVYVHCALGHGRSATFVAAYLLASRGAGSMEEAVELIRSRRKGIGLKPDQMNALRRFAASLSN